MSTSTPTRAQPPASSPRRRAGAHRTGGGFVGALIPSALAVAAVASLITALAVWQGEAPDQPRAAASSAQEKSSRPEPTPTPSPSVTASESAAGESSPSSEPTASQPVARDLEVVVLNQTSRRGLAGSVADALRAEGWDVYAVGNFRGVVPDTTVYHPQGAEAEALAVARDLPTEPRVKPRFGNLSTTRLTVVVTDSYPGG